MKEVMETGAKEDTEILGIRIFLVRHGETDWNKTHRFQGRVNLPLNQEGKDHARALALTLKDESLKAIYSSPLARAIETACIIKEFHPSTPFFEEEGFVEMNLGEFDGMEVGDWIAQYQDFFNTWRSTPGSLRMPGGENLQEVQRRAVDALERITELYPSGSTLLLCSHNFVNRTLLCYASGSPLDRFRDFQQDPAALNVLYKRGRQLWTEVVNDVSHLKKYEEYSPREGVSS
jgi:probable phosphoglycerate mutase